MTLFTLNLQFLNKILYSAIAGWLTNSKFVDKNISLKFYILFMHKDGHECNPCTIHKTFGLKIYAALEFNSLYLFV